MVLAEARTLFGPVPSVTMEQFFIRIEFLASVAEHLSDGSSDVTRHYKTVREAFMEALLLLLNEAGVGGANQPVAGNPQFHRVLFQHLEPDDAIISFNYDVVADGALATAGTVQWNPRTAYGVTAVGAVEEWRDNHRAGEPESETVYLLKMHGSLNWECDGDRLVLTSGQPDPAKMHIVAPAWNKRVDEDVIMRQVWQKAREALSDSDILMIVGYSLPQTDVWTAALMNFCAFERSKPFTNILIANPDEQAVARLVGTVSRAIDDRTRVVTLPSFEAMTDYLI